MMDTILNSIYDSSAIVQALALLAGEQVIAAPTDTVYGVMCRYDSPQAIEQLYVVKSRPPRKAIPVLIGTLEQLAALTPLPLSKAAQLLANRFWPGPLTLVLPAHSHLPAVLTAQQPTIAVRMPDHPALCALIEQSGPLAATSANRSGGPESHTAADVLAQLGGRLPLILQDPEGDRAPHKIQPSTIVDVTPERPRLLRPGPLAGAVAALLPELTDEKGSTGR
jgi:L-threonylcarbamoyladenylate synthase